MLLSPSRHQALRRCFGLLAEDLGEREVRERLGAAALDLFGADQFASFVWNPVSRTFGDGVALHMSPGNLAAYDAWFQHRDPITFALQARRSATLVDAVMPRADFVRTEFFNDFLARDGLHWGMNLHAFDGDRALGDLRIWRGRAREPFDEADRLVLDLLDPAFTAALRRARDRAVPATPAASADPMSALSAREQEVAGAVARGLTDKEIARLLGVSQPSIRTYLERIATKTGVRRRAGIAALACRRNAGQTPAGADPTMSARATDREPPP